jgi:hypothetical protein
VQWDSGASEQTHAYVLGAVGARFFTAPGGAWEGRAGGGLHLPLVGSGLAAIVELDVAVGLGRFETDSGGHSETVVVGTALFGLRARL